MGSWPELVREGGKERERERERERGATIEQGAVLDEKLNNSGGSWRGAFGGSGAV